MTSTDNMGITQPAKKRSKLKMFFYILLLFVLAIAALFLFGPRETMNDTIRFSADSVGSDLDAYLAKEEAAVTAVLPTATKEIIWAYPSSKAKTPISIVYLHGFSASKGEIRPVPDMVAKSLGANLFYTRLTGHGIDGAAMATATAQDWLDDAAQAIEIGSRIGEKIIVIGTSTGGTLAAVSALEPSLKDKIAGFVMISPNFKLHAAGSEALTFPFARSWLPLVAGAERSFTPTNELHATLWTHTYPTVSLLPMGALMAYANKLPFERITQPALFIYDEGDKVVDETASKIVMDRWGGETELHLVTGADDQYQHVIAGVALSPNKNAEVATTIEQWLKQF